MSDPAGPGHPTATVVICAYATARFATMATAVEAVCRQLGRDDELVVVIDHNDELHAHASSHFGTLSATRVKLEAGRLRVLASENASGLSGARNWGVAAARNELAVFLDDDAVPRAGWLDQLRAPFADPQTIGAGGLALPVWERPAPAWMPDEFLWVVGCSYRGLPTHAAPIRNPIGANMAFRRRVILDAGGFTDGIGRVGRTPLGCEETELSIRAARLSSGRIVQQPEAVVDHVVPGDRLTLRYYVHRCWAEGISKAVVARLAGSDAALASERSYATRTLPAGVLRGLRDGLRGRPGGLGRALAIIGGLAVTVAGYLRGSASRPQPQPQSQSQPPQAPPITFEPLWSGQIELGEPALPEQLTDPDGNILQRARLLVKAGGTPIGFTDIATPDGRVTLPELLEQVRRDFGDVAIQRALDDTEWQGQNRDSVSVVLCTHDRPSGVARALDALQAIRYERLEVIVVDNAPSDDATHTIVAERAANDPRIRYVSEPEKGLSRARNCGLRAATGELIAFTDDDVRVDPLWLAALLRGFARSPEIACVTGLVASSSLSRPAEQYFDQRVSWASSCTPRVFHARRGESDSPLHPYTAGAFGTGANFAIRSTVLQSLGGFDQTLGAGSPTLGGEDLDIFVRVLTAGYGLSYEPAALGWHDHRVDEGSLRKQMYGYGLGLTAYLTKYALARSSRRDLARRALHGVRHSARLLRRSSDAATSSSIASDGMTTAEIRGMLAGPLAYMRARRAESPEHLRAVAPRRAADR